MGHSRSLSQPLLLPVAAAAAAAAGLVPALVLQHTQLMMYPSALELHAFLGSAVAESDDTQDVGPSVLLVGLVRCLRRRVRGESVGFGPKRHL